MKLDSARIDHLWSTCCEPGLSLVRKQNQSRSPGYRACSMG
jgi:hypothetical protein